MYIYIFITFFNYQSINHASSHNKSHVDIKAYISKRMKILIHAQLADFGRRLLKLHQRHCTISQSVAADRQAALSAPDEAASPQESRSGNGRQTGNRPAPDSLDIAGVARHACIRNSKQHRRTKWVWSLEHGQGLTGCFWMLGSSWLAVLHSMGVWELEFCV